MEDNFLKESKSEEEKENSLIHSLEYRNPLQILIFKMLDLKDDDFEQVMKYSKIIRNIIDDPKNTDVRKLILQKNFEEASKIIMSEINKEVHQQRAA